MIRRQRQMCIRDSIYTVQDISNHINTTSSTYTHSLNRQIVQKKVFYKPREKRSLKRCVLRFFLKEERDGELRTFVGREFPLDCSTACGKKVERSACSRFKVSSGNFQQFFTAGPKSSRGLVGARKAHTYNYVLLAQVSRWNRASKDY